MILWVLIIWTMSHYVEINSSSEENLISLFIHVDIAKTNCSNYLLFLALEELQLWIPSWHTPSTSRNILQQIKRDWFMMTFGKVDPCPCSCPCEKVTVMPGAHSTVQGEEDSCGRTTDYECFLIWNVK